MAWPSLCTDLTRKPETLFAHRDLIYPSFSFEIVRLQWSATQDNPPVISLASSVSLPVIDTAPFTLNGECPCTLEGAYVIIRHSEFEFIVWNWRMNAWGAVATTRGYVSAQSHLKTSSHPFV